ncbi:MAG: 50S ribosomal protein L6 [Armatimonadota bacterium]|nr:50S ribosomal protein L6 [bacterium]
MSRIGQLPIPLPSGVQVTQSEGVLTVKGPKGTLSRSLPAAIAIKVEDGMVLCERPSNSKEHRSLHGLTRTLVNNMVIGVTKGYEKKLHVQGVGYRAELQGKNLNLQVGFAHPVLVEPMEGIEFEVGMDTNTRMPFVVAKGIDKEVLGQQAANIRRIKPPEPYKGKGIRYSDEVIRRKAGKSGKATK